MTAISIQDAPALLLEDVKKLGYDLYSEVLPSAIGIPVETKLSSEEWEAEADRLVGHPFDRDPQVKD